MNILKIFGLMVIIHISFKMKYHQILMRTFLAMTCHLIGQPFNSVPDSIHFI